MKVLHFCPLPLFSGLEQYALTLVKRQRALGVDASMVVLKNSALEGECAKADVPFHVVDFQFDKKSYFSASSQYGEVLKLHPKLDIIHLHTTQDIPRLALTFLRRGLNRPHRPRVIQQNHIWISHSKRDPVHWLTYRVVDEVWCSSEPARLDLIQFLPVAAEKIKVIRYGRDLRLNQNLLARDEARRELHVPREAVVLGAIARLDRGKGIQELVEGTAHILPQHPRLHLVIIGGATTSDPRSVQFAQDITGWVKAQPESIRTRIHLKGSIPDAGRFLQAFDMYAQVAYKETFSLALLDAQLSERPVIGTSSGGTPEVVRENETGWLCKPESTKSISETVERALRDQPKWAEFGLRARRRVENEFDIEVVLRDILNRYQQH